MSSSLASGTLPGAQPYSAAGGSSGALLLHGFTGTPFAMRATAERLRDGGLGVEVPLLPGHGTAVEHLVPMRWGDWASAAEAAYQALSRRCARVAVVGHSMGGTLACWLAERHEEICGIALVNPLVEPYPAELRAAAYEVLDAGVEVWPGSGPDVADPAVADYPTYDGTPIAAFLSLCEGVEEVGRSLRSIRCPVLVLSSREDHVVPPSNGGLLEATLPGAVTRIWLERSYHAAMVDYDHEVVEQEIVAFVAGVTADAADSRSEERTR